MKHSFNEGYIRWVWMGWILPNSSDLSTRACSSQLCSSQLCSRPHGNSMMIYRKKPRLMINIFSGIRRCSLSIRFIGCKWIELVIKKKRRCALTMQRDTPKNFSIFFYLSVTCSVGKLCGRIEALYCWTLGWRNIILQSRPFVCVCVLSYNDRTS